MSPSRLDMVRYAIPPLLCLLAAATPQLTLAQAVESGTTLYGAIDTSLRFQTHTPGSGASSLGMESGGIGGSHFGLRGQETMGGDLYAAFRLESGITPNTGTLADSSRLFNREAWVGLGGSWGLVSAGRHYTLIHDILSMRAYDALWVSNYAELGWYSGTQYTLRRDNTIRYLGNVNQVEVGLMYQTNERGVKNSHSVMAVVPMGGLDMALAHETDHTADTELRASLLALRYTFNSGTSVHAYTLQSRAQGGLDKKDQLYSLGVVHPVSPRTTLFGSVYYNRSKADGSGHRNAFALRAQYALSKRTFVYAEADHARVRGISVADFNDPNNAQPNTKRSSFSIGYRHLF